MKDSDLMDNKTWKSIVSLPDDVSLGTRERYGSALKKAWSAWGEWICLVGALQKISQNQAASPIAHCALDVADEFQASVYNALVGFYRLAFSSLRNVLEHMTIGLHLELSHDQNTFQAWLSGNCELRFGCVADHCLRHPSVINLECLLKKATNDSLFQQKAKYRNGGLVRRLFSELSQFTHGGPAFTNAELWEGSTGPIFVPKAFEKWTGIWAKTYSLGVLEAKLAQPNIDRLAYGSSLSVQDLFRQSTDMIPTTEDGADVLRATINLPAIWHSP